VTGMKSHPFRCIVPREFLTKFPKTIPLIAFREYKKHVEQEQKPALLLAQETERKMLGAPAKLKNGNS